MDNIYSVEQLAEMWGIDLENIKPKLESVLRADLIHFKPCVMWEVADLEAAERAVKSRIRIRYKEKPPIILTDLSLKPKYIKIRQIAETARRDRQYIHVLIKRYNIQKFKFDDDRRSVYISQEGAKTIMSGIPT